jgi:hypothetical protein
LNTLAGLISGIVGSKRTNLPLIASHVPDGTHPDSRTKRFSRCAESKSVTAIEVNVSASVSFGAKISASARISGEHFTV